MEKVALIGAGRMGLPIVRVLARAGHEVRVFDVRPELEPAVREAGAQWTPTLEALFEGLPDVLLTALPGNAELDALVFGAGPGRAPDGSGAPTDASPARHPLSDLLVPPLGWIDLTSASPELGARMAVAARERGVDFLEAPMGGGPDAAASGALTLYVGGDEAVYARYRTLLERLARAPGRLVHLGGHGTGYLTKLLINLLWFGQALAVGEAMLLGQAAGLAPGPLGEVLAQSPASSDFVARYLPELLAGRYLPAFGLDRCVEELESVRALAAGLGSPFALSGAVTRLYGEALRHFGPLDGELLGVAYLEQLAGRRLSDPPA